MGSLKLGTPSGVQICLLKRSCCVHACMHGYLHYVVQGHLSSSSAFTPHILHGSFQTALSLQEEEYTHRQQEQAAISLPPPPGSLEQELLE